MDSRLELKYLCGLEVRIELFMTASIIIVRIKLCL